MPRRQLFFLVILNALVSLAIAVAVVWVAEQRRPDAEELAALYTPEPPVVLIVTPTPAAQSAAPTVATSLPSQSVAPVATSTPAPSGAPEIYVVQAGDSLLGIALRFGLTMDVLMQANNLTNPDFVFVGQRLTIPSTGGSPATASGGGTPAATPAPVGGGLALRVEQPGNLAQEQVQVVNDSDVAVNLQGWTISRDGGPIYTFGNVPIFPGGSVRLHSGNGEANSLNLYWALNEPVWSSGAVVRLRNPEGTVMASVTTP